MDDVRGEMCNVNYKILLTVIHHPPYILHFTYNQIN